MYRTFESLPEEKRKRIIEACIDEFAEKGYELASTNMIIKNAEISKGILFHYFKNKKNLFLYIIDYIIETMSIEIYKDLENRPKDVFERILNSSLKKLKISYEYPKMYKVIMDAYGNMPEELKNELQESYSKLYEEAIPIVLKDIDTSRFRKDIDYNKAMEMILFAIEGLGNMYVRKLKNMPDKGLFEMEQAIEDMKGYLEILKYGIYEKTE